MVQQVRCSVWFTRDLYRAYLTLFKDHRDIHPKEVIGRMELMAKFGLRFSTLSHFLSEEQIYNEHREVNYFEDDSLGTHGLVGAG